MATVNQVSSVHNSLATYSGTGSIAALFGISTYFMSEEYKHYERYDMTKGKAISDIASEREKGAKMIYVLSMFFFLSGLVLVALSMSLFSQQKEHLPTNIPALLAQTQDHARDPDVNEVAILAGVAMGLVAVGGYYMTREFTKTKEWGTWGPMIYSAGWLVAAFTASCTTKALHSLDTDRLAWTIPGVVAIIFGTLYMPTQISHQYTSGPLLVITMLGFTSFTIGNSAVTHRPEP